MIGKEQEDFSSIFSTMGNIFILSHLINKYHGNYLHISFVDMNSTSDET